MKTFKIFSTAALALMMAACSSEDAALNNSPAQQQGRKVHFTATIAAPGGNAGTRTEYTEVTEGDAAGTINVAWKAKDEIALIHNGTKDVVTVETVNEDGSATITGDITVGTNGEAVTAYYPAAAIELNSDKNPVPAKDYSEKMLAQDGTLSYIASNLDLRVGKSTLAVDGDKATLSDNVKLASQIAIWKLSLLDGESNVLQATQVKIKGGESVLASTTTLTAGTSVVTLAIPTDVFIDGALTIEATVGDDTYAYTKTGVTFNSGTYYQSTVTMTMQAPTLDTPLTVEAITAGSVVVTNPPTGMKYSLNGGAKTAVTSDAINVEVGDKVAFYCNGFSNSSFPGTVITGSGDGFKCKVYGNIMSLIDEENFATTTPSLTTSCFKSLFNSNSYLTDASGLLLPATTLAQACYQQMFQKCTSLTTAPKLPATDLTNATYCYRQMFDGCTSLTTAPVLPATTLANNCYQGMFYGCKGLTTAPALPATTLAKMCYQDMFRNCSALTTAPELPATTLDQYCYYYMFGGCSVLTTAPKLPATDLVKYCYAHMFDNCDNLTDAYVKAAYTASNNECSGMLWYGKVSAVLHTTSENKASWADAITSNNWSTWTTADDWTD